MMPASPVANSSSSWRPGAKQGQKLLIEAGCDAEPIGHEQIQLRLNVTEDPASARREQDAKDPRDTKTQALRRAAACTSIEKEPGREKKPVRPEMESQANSLYFATP